MIKRLFAVLLCLGLLAANALAESGYPVLIDDDADLLTPLEESQLQADVAALNAHGAVAFFSTRQSGNTDLKAEYYFDARISPDVHHSGVVFMVDMANREIYVFTRGAIETKVGKAGAYAVTDNVYRYASAGQYYECARAAFQEVLTLVEGGRVFSPMRVICNLLLALSIGLIAAYLVVRRASVQRATARPSDTFSARADVRLSLVNKHLIKSTKRRRESSSGVRMGGGGGFSGGGGGGGGGGHGGGGSGGGHGF